ncbi:MAG: low specificity L-threonine aldolase [Arachnia propionica]|nr:MAG: low specificity L-threonine aldolase [Arachnia propionica]
MIDLRSDTVTRPSPGMLAAMAAAPVGDDVYGEDPTVRELEQRVADLTGHQAGLFCPTGSMANLLGVWLHVAPGSEVLCDSVAHIARAEMGAHGALHGVTMRTWTSAAGRVNADDVLAMLALGCGPFLVETALVAVEDTSNFGGGSVQDFHQMTRLAAELAECGVKFHLDGARLPNAMAVTGHGLRDYGELFDSVSLCLSKGLGAPIGSVLVASSDNIQAARVQRKRLGGGWRQAGGLAAAGLYALEHNLGRVADDHAAARRFAEVVTGYAPAAIELDQVATNIVLIETADAPAIAQQCAAAGILLSVLGPTTLRAVTHLDVTVEDCEQAGRVLGQLLAS